MTVKDLKQALEGLPDDCIVYTDADHGQTPGFAASVDWAVVESRKDLPVMDFNEEIKWDNVNKIKSIADAVLIGGGR